MASINTTVSMTSASTNSNSPIPTDVEEPRKKVAGSRGGKRSVTHLSKAQLARKRANDREAQRNIRQRTKEHIENLERKVKELEQGGRSGSIERVLKRNRELEDEVERLRSMVNGHHTPVIAAHADIPEILTPQKGSLEWMPESASGAWAHPVSHVSSLNPHAEIPASNAAYPTTTAQAYPATTTTTMGYNEEGAHQIYPPTESWGSPTHYAPPTQAIQKSAQAWSPVDSSFSQPSRFPDMQMTGFNEVVNQQNFSSPTCWQNQPSIYSFQMSTKLKSPVTYLDQLIFSVIQSHRHLHSTSALSGDELLGPALPSVHILFNQPGPAEKQPPDIVQVMEKYSAVIANRGFPLIPEKLASFLCMYRFIQFQILPTYETFQMLHEWQAPRPSQLKTLHPAWMDLPPWGKFRDKIIENQGKYDTPEFQHDYALGLSINFPMDPMKALIFDNGKIMISPVLNNHLSDINNVTMSKAFGDKYPEFRDCCRITEV
ncbi:hypothetical protein MBM_00906 [Drepanopeziza brunnea f. sp. 'multigermtubi' MB_m1]|uniref:BZIP transcription factor n=1 Tax=Marssonina brunnea f. sp. multigermtubi (strain MB_m1) TaxID=1072389 RepID=K1XMN7_MARBU|nr:uncharacterized protein MBM_00906 [Drepanopeziza brunnea f. sp. 'multigermtubi' MB_m1]EKD21793.1 hypothetical protein MBM_00906 [Drepanopeziza brunnea f. sp. 'multigermtubi' MB_m1]